MSSLLFLIVVVCVLAVAAVCAMLLLRSLGSLDLPENPPFPHRRSPPRRHGYAAKVDNAAAKEVVQKR